MPTVQTMQDKLNRPKLSKWEIMQAMYGDGSITLNGHKCVLSSVQREDGSGDSFNLEVYHMNIKYRVYVRADS